jgi:hypothetical protein
MTPRGFVTVAGVTDTAMVGRTGGEIFSKVKDGMFNLLIELKPHTFPRFLAKQQELLLAPYRSSAFPVNLLSSIDRATSV